MNESEEVSRLEQEIAVLKKRLSDAEAELQDFLFIISHDFKGPLRAIMSSSMILREDYEASLDSAGMSELKRQSEAAGKLNKMMEELLKISRLGRQVMSPIKLDVGTIFSEVAEMSGLRPSQIRVQKDMLATADRDLLVVLFENFIENTIKFSKSGQEPQLTFEQSANRFILRDDGIGVDPDRSHRAFLPFEKLNGDQYPGFGMGLTACKRIIDRHNGTLSLTGEQGVGAIIEFTIGL